MLAGEPVVNSMDIPVMFTSELESDTVNAKLPEEPVPEGGDIESAVGEPPVTFHDPTVTQPVFTLASAPYKYTVLVPKKTALNCKSRVTTTEVVPITTVVLAPRKMHWLFETTVLDPGTTGAAPLAGLS